MSSFLKPELQPNGAAHAPVPVVVNAHVPHSADVAALVEAAHEHIETFVSTELANIQTTLSTAWRVTEEALSQTRAELAELRRQHEALKALYAEAERKGALLDDIKKRLIA